MSQNCFFLYIYYSANSIALLSIAFRFFSNNKQNIEQKMNKIVLRERVKISSGCSFDDDLFRFRLYLVN